MIIDLFPTSIYMDSFELSPSDHANLSQVKLYRNIDEEAWVSDTNLHLQPWYQSIQGKIQTHVEKYIYDEMGLSKSYKMQCHGAWLNRNDKGDYTSIHHHSNSLISGVYYLAVQDTQGRIQFYDDKDDENDPDCIGFFKRFVYQSGRLILLSDYTEAFV